MSLTVLTASGGYETGFVPSHCVTYSGQMQSVTCGGPDHGFVLNDPRISAGPSLQGIVFSHASLGVRCTLPPAKTNWPEGVVSTNQSPATEITASMPRTIHSLLGIPLFTIKSTFGSRLYKFFVRT